MLRGNIQCSPQEYSVAELAFTECAHHCIALLSIWEVRADLIMDNCFLIFVNSCNTMKPCRCFRWSVTLEKVWQGCCQEFSAS
mmetsp:Transcript_4960/g.31771  ORF Transcript_4960/g.31771 Transcript_4960/m.31771 type:complete len:83 (-) Transcript_4960:874-1122(-)